jgi:hypothetical protein
MKILLIEDDSADAKLIREMLKEIIPRTLDLVHAARLSAGLQCISEERSGVRLSVSHRTFSISLFSFCSKAQILPSQNM